MENKDNKKNIINKEEVVEIDKLKKVRKARMTGIVVSDKMEKTVVIRVERIKQHPIYLRRYKVHKKYKAHDEKNEYKTGDRVVIQECRPISKDKRWRVVEKIKN